jgi:hypothetical protein
VSTRTTAIKQLKIKLLLSSRCKSAEEVANKWLASNAGKVKVYDIVYKHPNTDDASSIEIIYCYQPEPGVNP